jgi:hypothetical protein
MTMILRGPPIKRDEKTKESQNQAFQQVRYSDLSIWESFSELGTFVFADQKNKRVHLIGLDGNKKGGTWILDEVSLH